MLFEIEHRTHYTYDELVGSAGQYLRMTPISGNLQTVHAWAIEATGALHEFRDGHGNICHHRTIRTPQHELNLRAHGIVETLAHDGITSDQTDETAPPASYTKITRYTRADAALAALAGKFADELTDHSIEGLVALMHAIRSVIDYDTDATHVGTTAAEALAHGRGVCQDHAHVMLAICRHKGVPARYVSGYLWTGNEYESHAASHAWAQVHVPGRGWLNLDIANDCVVDAHYIRLAVGLDYADAGPLRGLRGGGGSEKMEVTVDIKVLQPEELAARSSRIRAQAARSSGGGTGAIMRPTTEMQQQQ